MYDLEIYGTMSSMNKTNYNQLTQVKQAEQNLKYHALI